MAHRPPPPGDDAPKPDTWWEQQKEEEIMDLYGDIDYLVKEVSRLNGDLEAFKVVMRGNASPEDVRKVAKQLIHWNKEMRVRQAQKQIEARYQEVVIYACRYAGEFHDHTRPCEHWRCWWERRGLLGMVSDVLFKRAEAKVEYRMREYERKGRSVWE